MGDHGLSVGALVVPVAEGVGEEFADEFGVSEDVEEDQHEEAHEVDGDHDEDGHLREGGEVDAGAREVEVDHDQVVGDQAEEGEGHDCEDAGDVVGVLGPHRPRQPPGNGYQVYNDVDEGHYSGRVLDVLVGQVDLGDGGVEHVKIDGGGEVAGGEGEQSQDHGDVEFDVAVETAVVGL